MKKLSLLLILTLLSAAQLLAQRTITGTVFSDDGLGLPNVTVLVNGSVKLATQTDVKGNYTIRVPANANFLRFSFVGMKTQDAALTSSNVLNVTLSGESAQIEGVVVMGYVSRGKNQTTGSAVQVSGNDLRNAAVSSVDQSLQGKVAGMAISTSSGTPGSIQDIRIRGVGSLAAGNDPLFVIDGAPVDNANISRYDDGWGSTLSPLSALNSEDIESISVLKDASTTSAYGARGSNGVIVITTKKGKEGKTSFNFSTYYGFQNKAVEGRKPLTGLQKEELFGDAVYNTYNGMKDDNGVVLHTFSRNEALAYYLNPANKLIKEGDSYAAWVAKKRPENNWEKVMLHANAPTFNAQLSAQGGSKESNFYASIGYNKTHSLAVGANYIKYNGALNYKRLLTDKITFSTSNSIANIRQNGLISEQYAAYANPISARYFMSPWVSPTMPNGSPNIQLGQDKNWLYLKDNDITINDYVRLISNSFIEWEFFENFKYKSVFSFDYGIVNLKEYKNPVHSVADGVKQGSILESIGRNFTSVFQNSLNYSISLSRHYISVTALAEYQKGKKNYLMGYGESFLLAGVTNINSSAKNRNADATFHDWTNASYLGLFNYIFDNKYIIDLTYRREGSSKFPKGNRYGNFGAVGVAWNIHNEDFLRKVSAINTLRIRGSYGISGNSDIEINSYQDFINFSNSYANEGAITPEGFGNNKLTWEKNHTVDVGLEFGLWKDLVSGSVSYFNKLTSDLLQSVPLPKTTGFNNVSQNVGSVLNTGIEAVLNIQAVKNKNFNLAFNINFATLTNEVKKLAKDIKGKDIVISNRAGDRMTQVGHPINEWYLRTWAGVDKQTGLPQWYKNGIDSKGGITNSYYEAQRVPQGYSPIPKYTGGFGFQADYKGLFLNANAYFAGGHKILEYYSNYLHSDGSYSAFALNGVDVLMNRWRKQNDITDVPKATLNGFDGNSGGLASSRFLFKGDYIRLKDVTLGYNLPKSLLLKIRYQGTASVFVKGANLFTFAFDKNMKYDPEVRANGYTNVTTPPVKSIIFGLNLNF